MTQPEGKSVPLKHPITIGSETRTSINVRRMKGKDIRLAMREAANPELGMLLIERLTGLDQDTVDLIDAEDFTSIASVVEGFTPPGLKDGKTPSPE